MNDLPRTSRPPFLTEYERDLERWRRRDRLIFSAAVVLAAAGVGWTVYALALWAFTGTGP